MEKQTTRQSVAEWYAQQIFENCTTPISEVEWLIEINTNKINSLNK